MIENANAVRVAAPLYRAKGWIKFAGVLSIIQGVFTILSIWGILICWLPIWMGVLLCSASNRIRIAFETNNEEELRMSMEKLGTYFCVMGIMALISLVIMAVAIVAAIMIPLVSRAY